MRVPGPLTENDGDRETEAKRQRGRRRGPSRKVSRTDPDASMATSACARRHEPCYKQHTAVDDARGVVLDVAVTTGAVSESRMIEAQVDAVRETTWRAIGTVTADAGYAYSKVFGGLERRRIDPVIPTRKDPSRSPVPLRRFRYDARHHLVRCPRGKILQPSDLMPAGLPRRLARVKRLRSSSMVSRGGLLLMSDTSSIRSTFGT